ncbi:MAG: GtrA family protein [Defluviitaleaceae bacterium]|nr:GtrA family protein [Defluviitaleaceae bacterium]
MKKTIEKMLKHETIRYIFFGGLTTAISVVIYSVCIMAGLSVAVSNTVSTVIAVSFAFITNKIWVFGSKDLSAQTTRGELIKFLVGRGVTYAIETGLLIFLVDFLEFHPIICKNFTQILIIVLNYIISKFVVFT